MWGRYLEEARSAGYGAGIRVPKDDVGTVPPDFRPSDLSLSYGARRVYRQDQPRDSLQIREYRDHYTVTLDRYNPRYHPAKHLAHDIPNRVLVAAGASALLLYRLLRR